MKNDVNATSFVVVERPVHTDPSTRGTGHVPFQQPSILDDCRRTIPCCFRTRQGHIPVHQEPTIPDGRGGVEIEPWDGSPSERSGVSRGWFAIDHRTIRSRLEIVDDFDVLRRIHRGSKQDLLENIWFCGLLQDPYENTWFRNCPNWGTIVDPSWIQAGTL